MMTPAQAWEIAHRRLVDGLGQNLPADALFVDDDDVLYGQPDGISVRRSALFELDADWWKSVLEPRPTWIHFNLLAIDGERSILSVRRSRLAMSPDNPQAPAVNVSAESSSARLLS